MGKRIVVEFAGETSRDRKPTPGPNQEDTCFNCDRVGHWATECRRPYRKTPRDQVRSRRRSQDSYDSRKKSVKSE